MAVFSIGRLRIKFSARGIAYKKAGESDIHRIVFPWARPPGASADARARTAYDEPQRHDDQYDEHGQYDEYDEYDAPERDDYAGAYAHEPDEYYEDQDDEGYAPGGRLADNDWLMWLLLLLLPPLGIALLWQRRRFELTTRAAVSAGSAIWCVVLLIWMFSGLGTGRDKTFTPPVATSTPLLFPTSSPAPTATPDFAGVATPDGSGGQFGVAGVSTPAPTPVGGEAALPTSTPPAVVQYVYATTNGTWYHSDETCSNMKDASRVTLAVAINSAKLPCPVCIGTTGLATNPPTGTSADTTTGQNSVDAAAARKYYYTPGGANYHYDPTCRGMKNALSADNAAATGKSPCPECVGSVYMTDGGQWYHKASNCGGMKDAQLVTIAYAEKAGKPPCPICIGTTTTTSTDGTTTTNTGNTGNTGAGTTTAYYYATPTGTYYHTNETCSGMKGATKITASAAERAGQTACPTCMGGTSATGAATYFANANGTYYHANATCSGMKNATAVTLATANARGQSACPTCLGGTDAGAGNDGTTTITPTTSANPGTGTATSGRYYSTADGQYFHTDATCTGMKDATPVSASEIVARGQAACPRCVGTSGTYYATPTGTYYHANATCSGMKGATKVTAETAGLRGQTRCPICLGGGDSGGGETSGTGDYFATTAGQHYHSDATCSGMKGASRITREAAEVRGQTACPRCIDADTITYYYATLTGSHYHETRNCSGMSGAALVTVATAKSRGQTACPVCLGGATSPPAGGAVDSKTTSIWATLEDPYYHGARHCSHMKNSRTSASVNLAWALNPNLKPCTKCNPPKVTDAGVNPSTTTVYVTLEGAYYHSQQDCSGMKHAGAVSLAWALDPSYEPCPHCNAPVAR